MTLGWTAKRKHPDLISEVVHLAVAPPDVLILYIHLARGHSYWRCFGSDRTPGVAPQGVFRSRTVSTTVAKWFVPFARGTMDKVYRFGPLRDA
jgi:hypothetical protein